MTDDLLTMCRRCEKVKIGNKWIGDDNPNYEFYLKGRVDGNGKITGIKPEDCPECVSSLEMQENELKRIKYELNQTMQAR